LIYVAINSFWEELDFIIPKTRSVSEWELCVNTFETPGFFKDGENPKINNRFITVSPRSIIILRKQT